MAKLERPPNNTTRLLCILEEDNGNRIAFTHAEPPHIPLKLCPTLKTCQINPTDKLIELLFAPANKQPFPLYKIISSQCHMSCPHKSVIGSGMSNDVHITYLLDIGKYCEFHFLSSLHVDKHATHFLASQSSNMQARMYAQKDRFLQ